jgi:hypothetical protein
LHYTTINSRVVHSEHFWAIFGSFLASFLVVWQKNDQNGLKNEVKNEVKIGYCEHSEMQTFENEAKCILPTSGSPRHIQTPPQRTS